MSQPAPDVAAAYAKALTMLGGLIAVTGLTTLARAPVNERTPAAVVMDDLMYKAIAVGFGLNPEGGTKYERFGTQATHSELFRSLILTKSRDAPTDSYFLRAESFYNLASSVSPRDFDRYGGRSLHAQSHGESFLSLVLHRLRGNGLYLFDEPEAALSPNRQLALLAAMHRLVRRNSQFIIATHSPILLGFPGATIYLFAEEALTRTTYLETEHYQITKAFLERPERMLNELLRPDDPAEEDS